MVSTVVSNDPGQAAGHTALVVNQFSSAANIAQRFDLPAVQSGCYTVRRGRNVFPDTHTVRLGSGDGICLEISPTGSRGSAQQESQAAGTTSPQHD